MSRESEEKTKEVMSNIESDIEFWKSSTRDSFESAAKEMIESGLVVEKVTDLLENLYHSCGDEYGS
ncbi:MAG: hypothetical protein ACR2PH_11615 [Desulfobulbia bacterium]